MAINFTFNPAEYEEQDFQIIPVGDHRVRIADVVEKQFKSGNEGFEITLDVSGFNSKLWFYLVINAEDTKQTNQRIGSFFDSFGITNPNLAAYSAWKGKIGAVRVKHEEYNGTTSAKAAFCIAKKKQDSLAPWKEPATSTGNSLSGFQGVAEVDAGDLPF